MEDSELVFGRLTRRQSLGSDSLVRGDYIPAYRALSKELLLSSATNAFRLALVVRFTSSTNVTRLISCSVGYPGEDFFKSGFAQAGPAFGLCGAAHFRSRANIEQLAGSFFKMKNQIHLWSIVTRSLPFYVNASIDFLKQP